MNPLYLIGILAGVYGISRMSAASTAAAKTAAGTTKSTALKTKFAGAGGTPLQQLQGAISDGENAVKAWSAATSDTWLDDNHNAMVFVLNNLMHWYTLTGGAGQNPTAYLQQHPELQSELQRLHTLATYVHQIVYKVFSTGTKAGGLLHKSGSTAASGGSAKSAKDLLTKAQSIINSFPSDGSDASAYLAWVATTAAQVPSLVSDIQGLVANASNAQQDIAAAMALIPQLTALVSKATAQSANAASSGTSPSTDASTPSSDPSSSLSPDAGY